MVFPSEKKTQKPLEIVQNTEALGQHRDVAEEKYGKAVTMGVTWWNGLGEYGKGVVSL